MSNIREDVKPLDLIQKNPQMKTEAAGCVMIVEETTAWGGFALLMSFAGDSRNAPTWRRVRFEWSEIMKVGKAAWAPPTPKLKEVLQIPPLSEGEDFRVINTDT
jgi:hypothetical protein